MQNEKDKTMRTTMLVLPLAFGLLAGCATSSAEDSKTPLTAEQLARCDAMIKMGTAGTYDHTKTAGLSGSSQRMRDEHRRCRELLGVQK